MLPGPTIWVIPTFKVIHFEDLPLGLRAPVMLSLAVILEKITQYRIHCSTSSTTDAFNGGRVPPRFIASDQLRFRMRHVQEARGLENDWRTFKAA